MNNYIGWRFLLSKRWFGYYAIFLVFAISCAMFGNWQFDRRAEAQAEISRIDLNYEAAPQPLNEVLVSLNSFDIDSHKWLPVTATGTYIGDTILVRNRPGEGGAGSDLINALQLTNGDVIFVDRGWVPVSGFSDNSQVLPSPPTGEVTVTMRLRAGEPKLKYLESTATTVGSINLENLIALFGVTGHAYTAAYGQLISEQPTAESGVLPAKPERDEGPHLSYALQWYVFIIIAFGGLIYAARQEFRNLNLGSEAVKHRDEKAAARKRRRGPTDADEEDAILDA